MEDSYSVKHDFSKIFIFGVCFALLVNLKVLSAGGSALYSLENSHNPFTFNGHVAAIFMVRLWFEEP
jgi:hypothetical protein